MPEDKPSTLDQLVQILEHTRGIHIDVLDDASNSTRNALLNLEYISTLLLDHTKKREVDVLTDVLGICYQPTILGGLGIHQNDSLTTEQESEILFLVGAWLESLNSADRAKSIPCLLTQRPERRRGMTISEKIFAMHDSNHKGFVAPGDLIRVFVDWILASEVSWAGMEKTYNSLGKPGIFRNDRFWLSGDHVVDPRVNKLPEVQALISATERAKKTFKMTEYQGMNYTILHTEFYRERAQPGMLVVGSDSHTCSAGAVGCLAIGIGAADVTLPLVTGETWFKVPEAINIRLVGAPKPGIGGKDVILYILQVLKRNTIASDRIVEFTGPGVRHLSLDARFAVSNMTTELGGITGLFAPDNMTQEFINRRKLTRHKCNTVYFKPDVDAEYAAVHEIDLTNVTSFIARYPQPDDVVPVTEEEGMELDGCFIGACTTTEEDLILGALVIEQAMRKGSKPTAKGKRKVVPGSIPILYRLRELGLCEIYAEAGFEIGIPGCSYCVGMSADQAAPGEVWISSQNRNFENRMGKGSIGHLASAATVAASSFEMKLSDVTYVEPCDCGDYGRAATQRQNQTEKRRLGTDGGRNTKVLQGKVQRLGDFVDTDALAPAEFLIGMKSNLDAGCGVQCVIAKSFAFIFQRNMPNLGLLGITMEEDSFFQIASDGMLIAIDLNSSIIEVDGKRFGFKLSQMESEIFQFGGIASAFGLFGKKLLEAITPAKFPPRTQREIVETDKLFEW
ncbi:Aconitase-like core [Penicillium camemberti]|uniref:Aconitase-like core n=1 Tax=Penicillium camemberti (strain FM 013) TaxID=1429867 RepID=A0A0G4PQ67_PENC3|nr:Aconitase-like core [Penicillium camemberti]